MLEKIDLRRKLSKKDYKEALPRLQRRLFRLQRACWELEMSSIVVIEGWDGVGKGKVVSKLSERLEPRGFKFHATREPRTYELQMPPMWRFWMKLPNYGEMALFGPSWYAGFLEDRVERHTPDDEWARVRRRVVDFERTLADDRYVVVKLFLHIGKKDREARLTKLEKNPRTSWMVDERTWDFHRRYDDYVVAIEEMMEYTESEWGPWTIVEATDLRWAVIKVLETLIGRLEQGLRDRELPLPEEDPSDPGADD